MDGMISIIIPAFNEERYLPRLLECIKKQSYNDYEVIVADANSTDKTAKVAKKYGCRIVKGGMPAVGRNNGAKAAKGNILLFLDADVQVDKNFLEKALDEYDSRKLDIAGCYLTPDSKNAFDRLGHSILNGWFFVMQYAWPHMVGQCIFSRKTIHKKLNGFDESILFAEDNDYVKRGSKFGKFRILNSVRITASTRRFKYENRFVLALKYLLCPFYRIIFGEIRTNIFKYKMKIFHK